MRLLGAEQLEERSVEEALVRDTFGRHWGAWSIVFSRGCSHRRRGAFASRGDRGIRPGDFAFFLLFFLILFKVQPDPIYILR